MSFMASGSLANMSATIGVSMVPGHTALMRIPLEAYSSAALFVSPAAGLIFRSQITPCLDAWYAAAAPTNVVNLMDAEWLIGRRRNPSGAARGREKPGEVPTDATARQCHQQT